MMPRKGHHLNKQIGYNDIMATRSKKTAGRKLHRVVAKSLCVAFLINQFLDKKAGTKLKDVAEAVGCSTPNIWGCYHDQRPTPMWIIINLCSALEVENVNDLAMQVYEIERARKAERLKSQAILAQAREAERLKNQAKPRKRKKKVSG